MARHSRLALAVAAGIIGSVAISTPALAASASCQIPWNGVSCRTGTIPAASGPGDRNFIDYEVCAVVGGTNYRVVDTQTGRWVKSGSINLSCTSGRIYGLCGSAYRLELNGTPAGPAGTIDNQ